MTKDLKIPRVLKDDSSNKISKELKKLDSNINARFKNIKKIFSKKGYNVHSFFLKEIRAINKKIIKNLDEISESKDKNLFFVEYAADLKEYMKNIEHIRDIWKEVPEEIERTIQYKLDKLEEIIERKLIELK